MKNYITLSLLSLSITACTAPADLSNSDGSRPAPHGSAPQDLANPPADPTSPPADPAPPSSSPDLGSAPAGVVPPSPSPDLAPPGSQTDTGNAGTSGIQLTDLVPPGGPVGTTITVLGSGFQAGDTVQISGSNLAAVTLTTLSVTSSAIVATLPTVGIPAPAQLTVAVQRATSRSPTALPFQVTSGKTYYLSPSGSDSASGSINAPWKTLNGAAGHLHAGDLVYLRGGTYSGASSLHISGTASAPIVFEGYPGERALVTNPASSTNGDTISVYGAYLVFDHIAFSNQRSTGKAFALATGSGHNVISNCELYGANGQGLMLAGDNDLIVNNLIHDNGIVPGHDHGIYIEGAKNIVRGNTIYNNFACGIQLYNGYGRIAGGNLIEYNYVYHNSYPSTAAGHMYGAAILLSTGQPNTTVRYNVLCNNARYAVYSNDASVGGNQVLSNVSCYNQGNGYLFDAAGSGTKFSGNISYNDAGFALGLNTVVTSDYNSYYVAGGAPKLVHNGSTMSLTSFRSASGQDLHSQIADPMFMSLPSSGFDWTHASSYDFRTSLIAAPLRP